MSKFVNHLKTILPNHYVPRRRASATEDINRGMIPAHWSGIVDLAEVFVTLAEQESSSDNGNRGTQHREPQWSCVKSMCQEGGLMAFKDAALSPPPNGSGGSASSRASQKVTDPVETALYQAFPKNGSLGSLGSGGGVAEGNVADEKKTRMKEKQEIIDLT